MLRLQNDIWSRSPHDGATGQTQRLKGTGFLHQPGTVFRFAFLHQTGAVFCSLAQIGFRWSKGLPMLRGQRYRMSTIFHAPQVSCREPFRFWKRCLKVKADLLHDTDTPGFFSAAHNKVAPHLSIKQELFRINLHRSFNLRLAVAILYIMKPLSIIRIQMDVMRTHNARLFCHSRMLLVSRICYYNK